jgi:Zn ribbon nucleic-acid-binding protein
MIPFSISDLIKLLEHVPGWKAVKALPERLTELEKRVAELEERDGDAAKPTAGLQCPLCEGAMKVVAERPHEHFDFAGVKTRSVECSACGHRSERNWSPKDGYR